MTRPLRIGVVGVGALSIRAVIPHLACDDIADRVVLAALCDPVVARANDVARRFGVEHAYASLSDMLEADVIDAVTVVSPIGLHFEHVRDSLLAGKHVHVNKTMTTTVAEADEVIDLARSRGLALIASPGEVLRPQVTAIRELIRSGAIGQPAWGICGCSFDAYHEAEPERDGGPGGGIDPRWYFRSPGGGPMWDMTAYALHQLTAILGPAQRVSAMSGQVVAQRSYRGEAFTPEVDDNTVALLEFQGGVFIVAHGTAAGWTTDQFGATTFYGTAGTLEGVLLNGEPIDFPGRELTTHAPVTDWEAQMCVLPHVTGPHRDIPESHVFEDVMQMVDEARSGVRSAASAEHARHVIEIIECAYRSARTGATGELTTTFEWPAV